MKPDILPQLHEIWHLTGRQHRPDVCAFGKQDYSITTGWRTPWENPESVDADVSNGSIAMLSSVRQEVFLHAPPRLESVFQQLLKIWEPREPRRDPQEIDGDPRNCLGAPGTTLAYCRVKYSTFLISHSASLHLRQNYADWYIRESHTEGYWGITCLKPAAVIGYPWLDFLIAAPSMCFFCHFCLLHSTRFTPPPHTTTPPHHHHHQGGWHAWLIKAGSCIKTDIMKCIFVPSGGEQTSKNFIVPLHCELMKRGWESATWYAVKHKVCPPPKRVKRRERRWVWDKGTDWTCKYNTFDLRC